MVAHKIAGKAIPRPHGPPVRAVVPDLYFWKSAKWLTGIRFSKTDAPATGRPAATTTTPTPGSKSAMAEGKRPLLRPWVRAIHRDLGYLAVGLTLVYALSGLAVNHISDWDPNFQNYEATHQLGPLAGDDEALAAQVLGKLGIGEKPTDVYRASPEQLDIVFSKRTLHVNPATGQVTDEGQKPRLLLRAANSAPPEPGRKMVGPTWPTATPRGCCCWQSRAFLHDPRAQGAGGAGGGAGAAGGGHPGGVCAAERGARGGAGGPQK